MGVKHSVILGFGYLASKFYGLLARYNMLKINRLIGGGQRVVQYPFHISGESNIIAENNINIGAGSTIMTTRAKLIIKQHFVSGPNLTIITGDHMPIVGKFLDTVTDSEKDFYDIEHDQDQDVIIEEDVWCGVNVTILKGVTIGRGCIIAAGAVVTKSIPPYYIAGGVPAKPLKRRWTVEQILEHERHLYPDNMRITKKQLELL